MWGRRSRRRTRRSRKPRPTAPRSARRSRGAFSHLVLEQMAATVTEHLLPIGGARVETGSWIDVKSPYSGDVIARVASGGAAEARRALDAAATALQAPLPAHERARVLDTVAALLRERADEAARTIS